MAMYSEEGVGEVNGISARSEIIGFRRDSVTQICVCYRSKLEYEVMGKGPRR